ncbi:DUF5316 family protein [Niallia sp. Sow4_A1]|jgi:NhaP-type Na+/H+ or K+/H+ antiporter|uniref:DUF5316 family protein n=1 Tax=Niallia hominis TaxID=3133173 RepID=A0ABV1EYU1_9BACI|nr:MULTISPECIES: DUF5316 family protein [Bacillaceae]MCF2647810.1 hypothetical protein [Niallia circulans]MCM3362298.1 DUF5316 domain-containing protein [Niallia sp. MER TA 168]
MFTFFLVIGIIAIFIAVTMVGAWPDGRQHRNHYFTETKEDRALNTKISIVVGLIGIVSLAIATAIYYFVN